MLQHDVMCLIHEWRIYSFHLTISISIVHVCANYDVHACCATIVPQCSSLKLHCAMLVAHASSKALLLHYAGVENKVQDLIFMLKNLILLNSQQLLVCMN